MVVKVFTNGDRGSWPHTFTLGFVGTSKTHIV